ncbi:hypothetical protein I2485_11550 [Nesterenkonia sp. E16_7]|uniref:hypothetical protein n=1 Tax=unclassified Nesterenkonia TaxID=2629769 RepID=UPI001A919614|nr:MULTISPECIES: hypothetical protein [unclassified Nesterenkonia]MBO0596122.1 hypothetical protein [Nesterenkonia sp. E16_10]MBO0599275.1 hypothetical protein [Nesterenkonia sp. E16_7]
MTFVEEHLRDRWLQFSEGGQPLAHTEAILAAAAEHGLVSQRSGKNVLLFDEGRCVGGLMGATPSMNSSFAQLVAASKNLTKSVLRRAGLPTPPAKQFGASEWTPALTYLEAQGRRRQVVKPADGRQGLGITTGVVDPEDLSPAWTNALEHSKSGRVLIEEEVPGVDVRILIVAGRAVAAATRIPPFVIGDGESSIQELADRLRLAREGHVYLRSRAVKVDEHYLQRCHAALGDVPAAGSVQFLNGTANLSQGGVAVDLTEAIPADALALAEAAAAAVPGLNFAGVDVLMPDLRAAHSASVIEVNTSPNLLVHDAPAYGRPRHTADLLIRALADPGSSKPHQAGSAESAPAAAGAVERPSWRRRFGLPGQRH